MENNKLGYMTASMITAYDCPRKFFYQYVEGWKPVKPSANLVFGSIIHDAIAEEFLNGRTTKDFFIEKWTKVGDLAYSRYDSKDSLRETGLALIDKLEKTEVLQRVVAVEKPYMTVLPNGIAFKGKVDLIYDDHESAVLLDWKTSGGAFLDSRPDLDDQLTAYSMLSGINKVCYGVLLKKKLPDIQFLHSVRTAEDYRDYQIKVMKVISDIKAGFFFKKPSMYCGFCDFSCLCRKQEDRIRAELKRVLPVADRYADMECEEVNIS
ncbi:MAG: PD-(D/E)XK nuclease family protein [Candidatus Theseobacter exili]|nr:PD-(D/E)XK nuclease family protein [Candidatus Theseobacter exili]